MLRRVTSTTLMSVFRSTKFKSMNGANEEEEEVEEEEVEEEEEGVGSMAEGLLGACSGSPVLLVLSPPGVRVEVK